MQSLEGDKFVQSRIQSHSAPAKSQIRHAKRVHPIGEWWYPASQLDVGISVGSWAAGEGAS